MDTLTKLRALNHLAYAQLAATNRLEQGLATQHDHALLDAVCNADILERVRAELVLRGIDVGFMLDGRE